MQNHLRELRVRMGLKQAALAKAIGIKNQASISEWENGKKSLSVDHAIMFSRFFHVTVGCVVGTEPIPADFPGLVLNSQPASSLLSPVHPAFAEEAQEFQTSSASDARSAEKNAPESRNADAADIPFSAEQIQFLDQWKSDLLSEFRNALRDLKA